MKHSSSESSYYTRTLELTDLMLLVEIHTVSCVYMYILIVRLNSLTDF